MLGLPGREVFRGGNGGQASEGEPDGEAVLLQLVPEYADADVDGSFAAQKSLQVKKFFLFKCDQKMTFV